MGTLKPKHVKLVSQKQISCQQDVEEAIAISDSKGWEGVMLRNNEPYKKGRSSDILKVKKMHDLESTVTSIVTGDMNIVKEGKEKTVKVMTRANIQYKSFQVGVGSGWTVKQRRRFYKHPEEIIGKVVTVQYFEETKNKNGGYSLRFPVVKYIHGEEREC